MDPNCPLYDMFASPDSSTDWLPHSNINNTNLVPAAMRQTPASQQHGMTAEQQLQGMLMAANNPSGALLKQQLQQQQQQHQSSFLPSSMGMPGSQMVEMNQQESAGNTFARFQQQQQQLPEQQLYFDSSSRSDTLAGVDNSSLRTAAAMGQSTGGYHDMMSMQHQQQQQQRFQNLEQLDAMGQTAAFNMPSSMGGRFVGDNENNNNIMTLGSQMQQQSFGGLPSSMTTQQQPQFGQQQMWINEPLSLQEQLLQHQQHQQQQLMGNFFAQPQQQQQFENFNRMRRESSMSEGRSLSPVGRGQRQALIGDGNINSNNMMLGNPDYARFLASSLGQPQNSGAMMLNQQSNIDDSFLMRGGLGLGPNHNVSLMRKEKKKRAKSFPEKLMTAMMENANEQAVAWLPDGKSFVIVSPDIFVNEVLNSVFKQAKYASFVRKLHRWGFVRLTSGTGTDCFHHPMFNSNRPEWASKIACAANGREATGGSEGGGRNISSTAMKAAASSRGTGIGAVPASTSAFMGGSDKPPSLAGVERFIRAKAAVTTEATEGQTPSATSPLLMSGGGAPPMAQSFLPTMSKDKMFEGAKQGVNSLEFSELNKRSIGGFIDQNEFHRSESTFMPSRLEDKEMAGSQQENLIIKGSIPLFKEERKEASSDSEEESLGVQANTQV